MFYKSKCLSKIRYMNEKLNQHTPGGGESQGAAEGKRHRHGLEDPDDGARQGQEEYDEGQEQVLPGPGQLPQTNILVHSKEFISHHKGLKQRSFKVGRSSSNFEGSLG